MDESHVVNRCPNFLCVLHYVIIIIIICTDPSCVVHLWGKVFI